MRLIDGDSLKHQIIETYEYEFPTASGAFDEFVTKIIPNIINNAPTVDAVEVVHGRWILLGKNEHDYETSVEEKCSLCGRYVYRYDTELQDNYCPNCGCKMDKEDET
jgi:hypothetical protein